MSKHYLGQKIAVLGSDGFVGKNLVPLLIREGAEVFSIGKSAGDMTDSQCAQEAFKSLPKVDRIFHCITRQRTGSIQYKIQGELLQINSQIHLNICEAWRLHQPQAKMIALGSSCAYPESDQPLSESQYMSGELHPSVKGYGQSKRLLVALLRCYAEQYGLKYLYPVLATMYGPHAHIETDRAHFVTAVMNRAKQAKAEDAARFEVWGNPNAVREIAYVSTQLEQIFEADALFENEVLNVTSGDPVTVLQVTETILSALDWKPQIVTDPKAFAGTAKKTLDLTLLNRRFSQKQMTRASLVGSSLKELRQFLQRE
jgi:GDP-L-fucose synthase